MSFQDLEAGYVYRKLDAPNGGQDLSHGLSSGIFQISTALTSYTKLVNQLGSSRDNPALRQRIEKTRQHIGKLIKETSVKLKAVSENDHTNPVSADLKVKHAKLAKEFQATLETFEKLQKLCAQRERELAFIQVESITGASPEDQHQITIYEDRRQELRKLDNEIEYNEAVIEERDQGIRELQEQIGDVHEIFKDLAVLVHQQGYHVEEIDTNVQNTHAATTTANTQLNKASRSQKSSNSLSCLLMVIFGVALVIVILVMAST